MFFHRNRVSIPLLLITHPNHRAKLFDKRPEMSYAHESHAPLSFHNFSGKPGKPFQQLRKLSSNIIIEFRFHQTTIYSVWKGKHPISVFNLLQKR